MNPDINNTSFGYRTGNNNSRNNKQSKPSSIKDMFSDSDSDIEEKETLPNNKRQLLPQVSVPEKIVFCIDTSSEIAGGYLFEDCQEPPSTHFIRNEAIRVFVANKLSIARHTEFAIISLSPGRAELVCPFSSNMEQIVKSLKDLKCVHESKSNDFDITSIFNVAWNIIDVPEETKSTTVVPPHCIIRLILMYGNSFLEPTINSTNEFYNKFISSPFCFMDVIYLHDKPSENNNVENIFKSFGKVLTEDSYLLENARNVTTMFNKMAKLLAHPCQRVSQEVWPF